MPSLYVVDASVDAKWQLAEEDHADHALRVLEDHLTGAISLIAPRHMRLEVASVLMKAARRTRLPRASSLESIRQIDEWGIVLIDEPSMAEAAEFAYAFGTSLYDALYVALAMRRQCPLISADAKLRNACAGQFDAYLWLPDYRGLTAE